MADKKEFDSNSERQLNADFTVSLLFSEPFTLSMTDVVDAVVEDYPHMTGWAKANWDPMEVKKVGDVVLGVLEKEGEQRNMRMSGYPGSVQTDFEPYLSVAHEFKGAREAVSKHRTHLTISITSDGADLASRFVAIRDLNCITAVFAKLPVCLAVFYENAGVIASPGAWVRAAETAVKDEWPLLTWLSLFVSADKLINKTSFSTCLTKGMAAFNGHEIVLASAPVPLAKAATFTVSAAWMLLAGGNTFRDSDTIGLEGSDEIYRLRLVKEGEKNSDTNAWVLLHPNSSVDEVKQFGARSRTSPPPGSKKLLMAQKKGFLSRILRRREAAKREH